MKELTLREIQQVELGILVAFSEFCERNDLRYSLGGGSLLGAVRHKGFIPWDDDVDVMMPRPDYDRFVQSFNGTSVQYYLCAHETTEGYHHLMGKLCDGQTKINEIIGSESCDMGVNIDVFPIDGLGASYEEAVRAFDGTTIYRELLIAAGWKKFAISKTHSLLYEPVRLALFLLSRKVDRRRLVGRIEEKNRRIDFDQSVYAGCVCGSYRRKEIMETRTFREYDTLVFEGHEFNVISNYDEYLRKHYGDYMQLPPADKQITHHTFEAYWVR